MSGARSRRKGAHFERELVQMFRRAMPGAEIKRGLQYRSGQETCDVDMPCFWLEAKHHHRVNIKAALEQALESAPKGRWPMAVTKDDRKPAIASMYLDDLLELIEQWWLGQQR